MLNTQQIWGGNQIPLKNAVAKGSQIRTASKLKVGMEGPVPPGGDSKRVLRTWLGVCQLVTMLLVTAGFWGQQGDASLKPSVMLTPYQSHQFINRGIPSKSDDSQQKTTRENHPLVF